MAEEKELRRKTKRKKKRRRKKNLLLRLLVFIALCVGTYCFLSSGFFDIQAVEVENNAYFTKEQVVSISGIKTGENIFRVSLSRAKDKLLSETYVKNVKLSRTLPDTVVVTLEERSEDAAIPYGEEYVLIDRDGMVLRKTEVEPALTLLSGLTVKKLEPGEPLEVEETFLLNDALSMLAIVEEHDLFFKKVEISKVIVKAYIYDGLICEGTPENIVDNIESVQTVIYDLYTKQVERGIIKVVGGRSGDNEETVFFSPNLE